MEVSSAGCTCPWVVPGAQHSCQTALAAHWAAGGIAVAAGSEKAADCSGCFPVFSAVPEWHQYDDIVCAKPSMMRNWWNKLISAEYKEVVEGKKIAATVMLESIFSILGTWSADNLRNFLLQLRQFHSVAAAQLLFEGKAILWRELNFSTEQVIPSVAQAENILLLNPNFHFAVGLAGLILLFQSSGTELVGILLG